MSSQSSWNTTKGSCRSLKLAQRETSGVGAFHRSTLSRPKALIARHTKTKTRRRKLETQRIHCALIITHTGGGRTNVETSREAVEVNCFYECVNWAVLHKHHTVPRGYKVSASNGSFCLCRYALRNKSYKSTSSSIHAHFLHPEWWDLEWPVVGGM